MIWINKSLEIIDLYCLKQTIISVIIKFVENAMINFDAFLVLNHLAITRIFFPEANFNIILKVHPPVIPIRFAFKEFSFFYLGDFVHLRVDHGIEYFGAICSYSGVTINFIINKSAHTSH